MAISVERDPAALAFERLYERYGRDVYRYALAITRDPAEAEDVTQTTFLNAWRAYREGQEPQKPHHWLIAIAQNACRLRFRTRSRRPAEVPLDEGGHAVAAPEGPRAADVLEALADLPLNQRAALVMRELEGRSYEEIAEILGVSRAAVETLIFRARRTMRTRHGALRALGLLPLPSWLKAFCRDRGFEGGAAAAAGTGGVAKAVTAAVAAGAIAVGVGSGAPPAESRDGAARAATNAPALLIPDRLVAPRAAASAAPAPAVAPRAEGKRTARAAATGARPRAAAPAPAAAAPASSPPTVATTAPAPASARPAAAPAAAAPAPAAPVVSTVAAAVEALPKPALPAVPAPVAELPSAPQLPQVTVPEAPALPAPPVPAPVAPTLP